MEFHQRWILCSLKQTNDGTNDGGRRNFTSDIVDEAILIQNTNNYLNSVKCILQSLQTKEVKKTEHILSQ